MARGGERGDGPTNREPYQGTPRGQGLRGGGTAAAKVAGAEVLRGLCPRHGSSATPRH
jgi:hypothetical protein